MNSAKESARKNTITITAVGDILLHGRVYGGLNKRDNYTFEEQLSGVKKILGKTDLTIANLETPIAGNGFKLSGFPKFNAPVEIGYVLKKFGVDLVTLANNHILDQGEKGLLSTISNLEKMGLLYDGAFKSLEDSETLRVFYFNGIKVCFISFTNTINNFKNSKSKSYLVNTLQTTSVLRVCRLLRKIRREKIADAIVVNLHFGAEYHLIPTSRQKEIAASLADAGANVIIGHHPHVLQPPSWIENSRGTKTFVAYSLGNFFSGQNGLHRQIGAALSFEIEKKLGRIIIDDIKYNLTFVNRTKRLRYDAYMLRDWVAKNKYIETNDGRFDSKEVYENVKARLRTDIENLNIE